MIVKLPDRDRDEAHGYRKVSDRNEEQRVGDDASRNSARLDFKQSVGFHFGDQPFVVAGTTSAKMEFNRSLHHLYHTCAKKSTLGGV